MFIPLVGVVPCSGEEIPEGTVARIAARIVLEKLRPNKTMTICLPLYLAGGKDEQDFVRRQPTIVIDGCNKRCAEKSIRKNGGNIAAIIQIPEIMNECKLKAKNRAKLDEEGERLAQIVAEKIAEKVDRVLKEMEQKNEEEK
ncbi:MAG: putative zinc-binding protein [Candidatus Jordarchaeaceae archaeon]